MPDNFAFKIIRYEAGFIESFSLLLYCIAYKSEGQTSKKAPKASPVGNNGIADSPADAVIFHKILMQGTTITPAFMLEMQTRVNDKGGRPVHGLGLHKHTLNGDNGWRHGGGGMATGCQRYLIPRKDTYDLMAVTPPVLVNGSIDDKAIYLKIIMYPC